MNLDAHGAACRCLLRLRENQGEPGISDAAFIARFLPRYPEWKERPGATDTLMIIEIARELGVASHADTFVEYDRVLAEHRAGRGVLLATARAPEEGEIASTAQRHIMLLVEMSADHFTAWCPYASGHSDILPPAPRSLVGALADKRPCPLSGAGSRDFLTRRCFATARAPSGNLAGSGINFFPPDNLRQNRMVASALAREPAFEGVFRRVPRKGVLNFPTHPARA